ncbi:MAG: carboxypeptidase-like regulatory domain-containing protein [Planctomycetes bacterium]|nr:carboxypeptidase-like regulatory domain-containing protein [Planctomycetota bacterium]
MRRSLFLLLLSPAFGSAAEISGIVLGEDGQPVAGAEVTVEIGKARYALTAEYDRWLAVETRTATTGGDGRFTVADLPEGAVATASVKGPGTFGVAQGAGPLEVKLAPAGTVKGKVIGKGNDVKQLRVYVVGGMGIRGEEGEIDKRTGAYEVEGLAPGPGRVLIKRGNWDVARHDVEIVGGKTAGVPNTKIREGARLPTADPEVEVTKAKLVDPQGTPVPSVQLIWSSQWMDGGMDSDKEGVVLLAGGGVAIGGPPYLLRLQSLRGKEGVFEGELRKTAKGTAIVELRPLAEVAGTMAKGAAEKYVLLVVGPGDKPRVYEAQVENGRYTVHVPRGKCRFVVGTVDGKTREHAFEVQGGSPVAHDIALE